jgi:hypothetical protein
MSMSWEHKCIECEKEFDSFAPRDPLCYSCAKITTIGKLTPDTIVKVTDTGGYKYAYMFVRDLQPMLNTLQFVLNDPNFVVILEYNEIKAVENHLGHNIKFE